MFANILILVLTKQNTLSYSCYGLVTLLVPGHILNKKKDFTCQLTMKMIHLTFLTNILFIF